MKLNKVWDRMFTKREQWLFLMSLFLLIIIYGASFNIIVMESNDGKMPVHWDYNEINNEHIHYKNITEAKYWIFGDIIGIKGRIMFSIGDIIVFAGVIGALFSFHSFEKLRYLKKEVKNDDR